MDSEIRGPHSLKEGKRFGHCYSLNMGGTQNDADRSGDPKTFLNRRFSHFPFVGQKQLGIQRLTKRLGVRLSYMDAVLRGNRSRLFL